jgi:nonribosomal peptide synthetase DhbF
LKLPLSFAQRRLWFLHRLEGPSATYNIPVITRVGGALEHEAFTAAVADVVARHEVLRTVYAERDGEPVQHILRPEEAAVPVEFTACAPEEVDAAVARAGEHAFDLAAEAPVRVHVFEVAPEESVLVVTVHHIAADGWSMGPLAADLSAAYAARCAGRAPGWEELEVQYADYTLWQRELLEVEGPRQLDFWRSALEGMPEELALPADRPRPATASYRGGSVPLTLDAGAHAALRETAQARQASLFMVVQAAVAALLTRLGCGTDIPLGTVVAGRGDEALENLVGFFVNTLVLRNDTTGNPTFTELLDRTRRTDLAAYDHQDLPFERLVEDLQPTRSLARHPLFQVYLSMQSGGMADFELAGFTCRSDPPRAEVAKFDLSFFVSECHGPDGGPSGLDGFVEYSTDLFDRSTAEAVARRLTRVLEQVAADPSVRLRDLDVLSPQEHRALREARTAAPPAPRPTVARAIGEQAARTPDLPAVLHGGTTLTYRALDEAANRLARVLRDHGAGPERVVALALPRSEHLVVAMLAVLRSGAAFLPLDTAHPPERVAATLRDARPALLLTGSAAHAQVTGVPDGPRTLRLDDPATRARIAAAPAHPLGDAETDGPVLPGHAAYLIYTSGSTGRPKGVVVTHGNLANLLSAVRDRLGLGPGERMAAVTTSTFDPSVTELLGPLVAGAACVVASRETVREPADLAAMVTAHGVTIVQGTPSLWQSLLRSHGEAVRGVHILSAGETLPDDLARRMTGLSARVTNLYGPTETTVYATWSAVLPGERVTIGGVLPHTRAYVLDDALRPVPTGSAGELYLAGEQVARGYLDRPALTAGRFVADPLGPPGTRMYRTGDLARLTTAGDLEFLGRTDHQVKVRGFRIEPGEIEAAAAGHPDVARAFVLARRVREGETELVCHLVPEEPGVLDTAAVREHLASRLPGYMVPAHLVHLAEVPVTASGKLDRAALPDPSRGGGERRAPRTPREETLCALFAEVLGLDAVGIDDGFFDLGGHSLLVTRLTDRIRDTLGLTVRVRTVFEAPTVARLARALDRGTPAAGEGTGPVLTYRDGSGAPVFLLPPANGLGWAYSSVLRHLPSGRPVHALQDPRLSAEAPVAAASITDLARAHLARVREAQPAGPYTLLGWSLGGMVAQEMAAVLEREGEKVALLVLLDPTPGEEDRPPVRAGEAVYVALDGAADTFADRTDLPAAAEVRAALPAGHPLASLPDPVLGRLLHVTRENLVAAAAHRPRHTEGPVLVVDATEPDRPGPAPSAAWKPFLGGEVTVHRAPHGHFELVKADAMAGLGPIIGEKVKDVG